MVARGKKPARKTEPAHSLLYEPDKLPEVVSIPDAETLLDTIASAKEYPFNERQRAAFSAAFTKRLSLVWGPPGTGKTTVMAGIVLGYLVRASVTGKPVRIGVGASNYNALDKVLVEAVKLYERYVSSTTRLKIPATFIRVRSSHTQPLGDERIADLPRDAPDASHLAQNLESSPTSLVVGGTWMQLGKLCQTHTERKQPVAEWFDLLIIDEASQMDTGAAGAYFLLLAQDGHVVLAGDHKQLGPIYGFDMQETKDGLLDCIFSYMQETHELEPIALTDNYRNNEEIASYPRTRFYPEGLLAKNPARRLALTLPVFTGTPSGWSSDLPWTEEYLRILDPNSPVVVIAYGAGSYTLSNSFEAQTVAAVAALYRRLRAEQHPPLDENDFWDERLGIMTPHRAQMAGIRNNMFERAGFSMKPPPVVDTVDRFQGQERDLIIASYTVADPDFVGSEDEFILSPRRFNVTLTRARSKFIMMISDAITQYLPADKDIAEDAAHIQLFVEEYCSNIREVTLPFIDTDGVLKHVPCSLRTSPS